MTGRSHEAGEHDPTSGSGNGIPRRHVLRLFGAGGLGGLVVGSLDWSSLTSVAMSLPPITIPEGAAEVPASQPLITVADKAAELDYDLQRMFAFVRDEIAYEPYAGILRGPTGTLQSGAGNAADQAMLLAALLDEALVVTRYVEGPLDEAASSRVMDGTELDREQADAVSLRPLNAVRLDSPAADAEPDPAVEEQLRSWSEASSAVVAAMTDRIDRVAAELQTILTDAGVVLPETASAMPDLERTRHLWVQYADGPLWIDLDASLPWLDSGSAGASATTLDGLPDDWFHRVVLRVRVEEISSAGVSQRTLVEHQVRSADLVDTPVSLVHAPPALFKDTGFAVVEALTGVSTLYPTIVVGPDAVADQPISVVVAGGVNDVFGDLSAPTDSVAEWLDVEFLSPGAGVKAESRTIFDRAGAERRTAGEITPEMLAPVELITLDDAPDLGSFYPPLIAIRSLWIAGGRVPHLPPSANSETDGLSLMAGLAAAYRPMFDAAARGALHARGHRTVIDEPCAVLATFAIDDTSGASSATVAVDLVNRGTKVLPVTGGSGEWPGGLLAGVASHVAERALLDGTLATEFGLELPPREERSVGRLFELAAEQGIGYRVLQPSDADPNLPDGASAEAEDLVRRALTAGLVVIAPERTVDIGGRKWLGWWLVDPVTGQVRDQFETGEATELTDFATILNVIVGSVERFKKISCIVAVFVVVAQIIADAGMEGSSDRAKALAYGKTVANYFQMVRACTA